MEQQHEEKNGSGGGVGGGGSKSSFLCRQSSTRWIPTSDQIRILRDLYYVNGLRSPNAEQIQRISARLRQYGKIEGKNVFYWFQNHKARERQKKRLTVDVSSNNKSAFSPGVCGAAGGATSPGLYGSGHMGSNGCGGSMHMERGFRESCIFGGGDGSLVESNGMGWTAMDAYASPWAMHNFVLEREPPQPENREMETLQLFPMHTQEEEEEHQQQGQQEAAMPGNSYFPGYYWADRAQQYQQQDAHNILYGSGAASSASLELTLNSYYYEGSSN